MTNKNKYRGLSRAEETIPIFSKDWWLDAVCGENNWDVALVEKDGQVVASLPYYMRKKYGLRVITMPKLTQTMGPWIKYPAGQSYSAKLSFEKEIFNNLISQIPKSDLFVQNFHYSISNWLPFYWAGYVQTTHYTYAIEDLSNLDGVFDEFDHSKIKNIKRAEEQVMVQYDLSAKEFYENHKMTLSKQGAGISYSEELFRKIYEAAYMRNAGKTIFAKDRNGNLHSAFFVIWDKQSAYYLISTIDPDHRSSGSASLLMREIIKYVSARTKRFDFEGSMISGLRRFVGNNPIILIVNKIDILPKSSNLNKIENWVRRQLKQFGMRVADVVLVSAKKDSGFNQAVDTLNRYREGRDVYVVGATNVGKSTFLNRLISDYSDLDAELTVSRYPGTTLDLVKIPLDDGKHMIDTPGIVYDYRLSEQVSRQVLELVY